MDQEQDGQHGLLGANVRKDPNPNLAIDFVTTRPQYHLNQIVMAISTKLRAVHLNVETEIFITWNSVSVARISWSTQIVLTNIAAYLRRKNVTKSMDTTLLSVKMLLLFRKKKEYVMGNVSRLLGLTNVETQTLRAVWTVSVEQRL